MRVELISDARVGLPLRAERVGEELAGDLVVPAGRARRG